jgi:hypothetical protein
MGDIPILTARALEIAAQAPQGKPGAAGIVVEKGFFLNGRDHYRGYPSIDQGVEGASPIQPGLTIPPFALRYNTPALANSALNPFIGKSIIEDRFEHLSHSFKESPFSGTKGMRKEATKNLIRVQPPLFKPLFALCTQRGLLDIRIQ